MQCPECQHEMVQSKAGWLCLNCGHADSPKPSDVPLTPADPTKSVTKAEPAAQPTEPDLAKPDKVEPPGVEKPQPVAADVAPADKPAEVEKRSRKRVSIDAPIDAASEAKLNAEPVKVDAKTDAPVPEVKEPAKVGDSPAPEPAKPELEASKPEAPAPVVPVEPEPKPEPANEVKDEPKPAPAETPAEPATDSASSDKTEVPETPKPEAEEPKTAEPAPAPAPEVVTPAPAPAPVPDLTTAKPVDSLAPADKPPVMAQTHPHPKSAKWAIIAAMIVVLLLGGGAYMAFAAGSNPVSDLLGTSATPTPTPVASASPTGAASPAASATPTPAMGDAAARDSQRQADVAKYVAAYKATAKGGYYQTKPPTVSVSATDPTSGQPYQVVTTKPTTTGQIYYWAGGSCTGQAHTPGATSTHYLALETIFEGSATPYCIDVQ